MSIVRSRIAYAGAVVLLATAAAAQTYPARPLPANQAGPYVCEVGRAAAEMRRMTDIGLIVEVGEFPPNVSVVVDKPKWDRAAPAVRRRWVQEIACATGERYANMLRTITVRARDSTRLGSFSSRDLQD
ncbi:hypothetical protein PQJ75_05670 [Rhodoplanes sp. TEM]|uniref:Uncharacterized protein n=1 Tax=Rhodoplanes tepidamans TaxID=200616 RepID=A0ABT5J3U0_RHOTP|nr:MULTISPECIES: hypothetical protein [Rhodoplanes]MDC7784117.1 hypothetical protein [Rhodoplanes tepidamans]MDC7983212.1 hypothetical protein [Rhodoplanes sp. TEM]MDQ0356786.1 hypothetical protein [Rhodoplanes tepidamans]